MGAETSPVRGHVDRAGGGGVGRGAPQVKTRSERSSADPLPPSPQPPIPAPSSKKLKNQPHAFLLKSAPGCFFFRSPSAWTGSQCLGWIMAKLPPLDYVFLIWRQQEGGAVPGNANSGFAAPAILPSLLTSPDLMGSLSGPRGLLWE